MSYWSAGATHERLVRFTNAYTEFVRCAESERAVRADGGKSISEAMNEMADLAVAVQRELYRVGRMGLASTPTCRSSG